MLETAAQARVLGALIEKSLTTPQQYPLSANAVVLACNQSTNRSPVVAYSEDEVLEVLEELRSLRLVRFALPSHGRSVVRYRHVLDEVLGADARQLSLLAMLVLRGPQTLGELRARTERMADFDSAGDVEHDLERMAAGEPPLVRRLARQPGQKEERWVQTLWSGEGSLAAEAGGETAAGEPGRAATGEPPTAARPDLVALAEEVAALHREVGELRGELEALRSSLGG